MKTLATKIWLSLCLPIVWIMYQLYKAHTGITYNVNDNPIEELKEIWRN